jgi:hypothetical protein
MTQQFDLTGLTPPPKPTDRLFFAMFPSEEAIPQIVKMSQHLCDVHGLKKTITLSATIKPILSKPKTITHANLPNEMVCTLG